MKNIPVEHLPKKGQRFLCVKEYSDIYIEGKIYECLSVEGLTALMQEEPNSYDRAGCEWSNLELFKSLFKLIVEEEVVQKTGEIMAAKAKEFNQENPESWKSLTEKVQPVVEYWKEAAKEAGEKLENSKHKGLRFNSGKKRFDLVHPWAHEQMVNVLTKGAQKYAERNWERGMLWSNVIASLERHFVAIKSGEDFDPETGELHAAHLACNAHFLTAYYKIYPQGDDRPHAYLNRPKIGLDIDEVIADFVGAWTERHGMTTPECWNFDTHFVEKMETVKEDREFWRDIKPRISPKDLPFEPHCYITSRSIPKEWTEQWIADNGFPTMPVYCVGFNHSKVDVAKESGIDIFVDDRYENFVELNNAGICTFLMDAAHNRRYDVGYRRVHSLKELV